MATGVKIGDSTMGSCGAPATVFSAGSADVFINNGGAVRIGDAATPHVIPNTPPHPTVSAGGSSKVFINGVPASRAGDNMSCSDVIKTNTNTVHIG